MNSEKKSCILFCPSHKTSFAKLLQIASAINVYSPIVFLISNSHAAENIKAIKQYGFDYVYVNSEFKLIKSPSQVCDDIRFKSHFNLRKLTIVFRFLKKISFLKGYFTARECRYVKKIQEDVISLYTSMKRDSEKIFNDLTPTLVIASGDRALNFECCILSVARSQGIKILIPPISAISGSYELARIRFNKKHHNHVTNDEKLIASYPKQFFSLENKKKVSFYPVWMIKPLDKLDLLPSSPWIYGESFADIVMIEGEFQKHRSIKAGVPQSKLRVVGDTELDELYTHWSQYKKKSILKEKENEGRRKVVVIALPQLYEHGLIDFDEQWQLVCDLCNGVTQNGGQAVLCLHPKMPLSTYKPLENIDWVSISSEPLRKALAQADIFVASNGSSTWLWAAMCGIPTILCDWSGLNYDYIDTDELGVEVIRSKNRFSKYIQKLVNDEIFYFEQAKLQELGSSQLALFDGKASNRIEALINSISRDKKIVHF